MKYLIEKWSIEKLINQINSDKLILSPPFQRNFVWNKNDQEELIESIRKGYPLPTIFIYKNDNDIYEMIDGQQRTRTLIRFVKHEINDNNGRKYSVSEYPDFLEYELPVAIITKLEENDSLEEFYTRVNKLGKKINRPELNKAQFLHTNFLKLVEELTQLDEFQRLDLFSNQTILRMNDRDFVEEIVSFIKFDFTDKKLAVDGLFKNDISSDEAEIIKDEFVEIMRKILVLNNIYLIRKTRYRQKNDFYTLFSLIYKNSIEQNILNEFYKILVLIGKEINPSIDNCEVLKEYALNCVSQSNSKSARQKRYDILKSILMNEDTNSNKEQEDIITFYKEEKEVLLTLVNVEGYLTFNWKELNSIYKIELLDVDES